LIDVVTNPYELSVSPKISADQARGFGLFLTKEVMLGNVKEVFEEPKTNIRWEACEFPQRGSDESGKPERMRGTKMVGTTGFEPATSPTPRVRDTRLRYVPTAVFLLRF
jgi:hypothetical protein